MDIDHRIPLKIPFFEFDWTSTILSMLNWELLTAALDHRRDSPMFVQLSEALANDIRNGRLKPGDPLPGTRALATRLRVHRNTIIAGYKELMAQGLLQARRGGGTFVAEEALSTLQELDRAPPTSRAPTYSVAPPPQPLPLIFPPDPPNRTEPLSGGAGRAVVPDLGACPCLPERPAPPSPESPQLR